MLDRTSEFFSFVNKPIQNPIKKQNLKFYDEFFIKLEELKFLIDTGNSYKILLQNEDKLLKYQDELNNWNSIEVENYLKEIFEGIKSILKIKLLNLIKKIKKKKNLTNFELKEEKSEYRQEYKQGDRNGYKKLESIELENIELENKQIIHGKEYEITRQRLQKIDEVQKLINEQLMVQDERIDDIGQITDNSKNIYKKINKINFNKGSKFFRRLLYKLILTLTFVLIFMHLLNR